MTTRNKIKNFFISFVAAAFVISGFFILRVANSYAQQSSCIITITSMEGQNSDGTNLVSHNSTVTFYTTVTHKGTYSDCQSRNTLEFDYYAVLGGTNQLLTSATASFNNNDSLSLQPQYSLSGFDFTKLPDPSQLEYFLRVTDSSKYPDFADTRSWHKTLTVSGSTNTSGSQNNGAVSVAISFGSLTQVKLNDNLQVFVNVADGDISSLPQNVDVFTYVGKNNQWVGKIPNVSRDLLKNNATYQNVSVTTANGFGDGANTIRVDLQPAGSQTLAGRGTANIQATGFGAPAQGSQSTTSQTGGQTGGQTSNTANTNVGAPVNPLAGKFNNLFDLFFYLLKILMGIIGAMAVLMIIIGGFKMVLAQGNEEAYTKAKSTVTWAIIGLVVALLSFSMVVVVQNILGAQVPTINQSLGN